MHNMTFSTALELLKRGFLMQRKGWNGKGMYVQQQTPDAHSKMGAPYLLLSTVDGVLVPWTASQTDILSDDWGFAE